MSSAPSPATRAANDRRPAPTGSRRALPRTRVLPAALGIALAGALAACGSGQVTQTDAMQSAVNGASGTIGAIAIRDAELAYPANAQDVYPPGSSATLMVTIANTGINPDQLVSVSSPAATGVTIDGSATGTKPMPGNFSIVSGVDVDDSTSVVLPPMTSSAPPVASATSAAPTTAPSTGKSSGSKPSNGSPASSTGAASPTSATSSAPLPPGTVRIVLTGIRTVNGAALRAGLTIPITFTFAHAGSVTLAGVPIAAAPDSARINNSVAQPSEGNN